MSQIAHTISGGFDDARQSCVYVERRRQSFHVRFEIFERFRMGFAEPGRESEGEKWQPFFYFALLHVPNIGESGTEFHIKFTSSIWQPRQIMDEKRST